MSCELAECACSAIPLDIGAVLIRWERLVGERGSTRGKPEAAPKHSLDVT